MNRRARPNVRLAILLLVCVALVLAPVPSARSDSAPMWPSPIGLAPGYPGTTVRLVSERVDVRVVERDGRASALVDASFDLLNAGPDVRMQVGFPTYVSLALSGPEHPYSPVTFNPELDHFTAHSEQGEHPVTRTEVALGDRDQYAGEWYVWEMAFPTHEPVHLTVSYEQPLTWEWERRPVFAQVMYVLRTGALWDGPIGEATIVMTAPDGGAFIGGPELLMGQYGTLPAQGEVLGPNDAAEAADVRLVWHLLDVEPTQDVGALYVYADAWRTLQAGEEAVRTASSDAEPSVRAGRVALRLTGSEDGLPWGPFGAPKAVLERGYHRQARDWADRAVLLAPDRPAPWELLGDVEVWSARPDSHHMNELACWPTAAADAYQRAAERGSEHAEAKLRDLDEARAFTIQSGAPDLAPCPAP